MCCAYNLASYTTEFSHDHECVTLAHGACGAHGRVALLPSLQRAVARLATIAAPARAKGDVHHCVHWFGHTCSAPIVHAHGVAAWCVRACAAALCPARPAASLVPHTRAHTPIASKARAHTYTHPSLFLRVCHTSRSGARDALVTSSTTLFCSTRRQRCVSLHAHNHHDHHHC
jgi:hypothetical protein